MWREKKLFCDVFVYIELLANLILKRIFIISSKYVNFGNLPNDLTTYKSAIQLLACQYNPITRYKKQTSTKTRTCKRLVSVSPTK